MRAQSVWKIIAITVMANAVNPGSTCNRQMPGIGPRLLSAKAVFGDVMRTCKKEIVELAKVVPSADVKRLVRGYCHYYNACKEMVMEEMHKSV
ncbi:hypothetical protein MTO96_022809 [Rhipicephalus appendiculatus]